MKKNYSSLILLIALLILTSCVKYGVSIDFSARGTSAIKYSFTFSRMFEAIADSAIISNNVNKDSIEVIKDSMNVTLIKKRKFKLSECSDVGLSFSRSSGGYSLEYTPKGFGGGIAEDSPDTNMFFKMLTYDVSLKVNDGKIISHNGDSIRNGVVYKTFTLADSDGERSLIVEVKTMNTGMIVILALFAGALVAVSALYVFLRSRRNELE